MANDKDKVNKLIRKSVKKELKSALQDVIPEIVEAQKQVARPAPRETEAAQRPEQDWEAQEGRRPRRAAEAYQEPEAIEVPVHLVATASTPKAEGAKKPKDRKKGDAGAKPVKEEGKQAVQRGDEVQWPDVVIEKERRKRGDADGPGAPELDREYTPRELKRNNELLSANEPEEAPEVYEPEPRRKRSIGGIIKGVVLSAVVLGLIVTAVVFGISLFSDRVTQSVPPAISNDDGSQQGILVGGVVYDVDTSIARNMQALAQGINPATVLTQDKSEGKKIALTIDGMKEEDTMNEVLEIVKRFDTDVSFFVSGVQAAEEPTVVKSIDAAGYEVGNYTLRAEAYMENKKPDELIEDFTIADTIISETLGHSPKKLKANATAYTTDVLRAASACGIPTVVQSTAYLTYHSFKSYDEVRAYVNRLPYESILSIKLSGVLDESEYSERIVIEDPALDKQESLEETNVQAEKLDEKQRILQLVEWTLRAIEEADFSPLSADLREQNDGKLAEIQKNVHTSEAAVAYTFYGDFSNQEELDGVLKGLKAIGGKGTFFFSAEDMEAYPKQVASVIADGHAVGIAHYAKKNEEYFGVSFQLLKARDMLAEMGVEAKAIMQPWGDITDALREAVSAMGCILVAPDMSMTRTETQAATRPSEVVSGIYKPTNTAGFQRGYIIGYRMGFFENANIMGGLIQYLQGTRNVYQVKDAYAICTNTYYRYTYPLPQESILPEVLNKVYAGQGPEDFFEYAKQHYIGNKDISTGLQLPGFSSKEVYALDKTGKVRGAGKAVFLTIDDWGTDVGITKLLDVLRKHNAKATFFVRTEYVPDNPNLLRAIAMDGHEIASHTHVHFPLSNDITEQKGVWAFEELTAEQVKTLKEDLVTSYNVLQSIVGDLRNEKGNPVLSLNFRPPTMAVGRSGMEAVFDVGYEYVVNASYTSKDYAAESAEELDRQLRLNVRGGSVVILHMSDNTIYTADALDIYFTKNEQGLLVGGPYTFARLSDYLERPVRASSGSTVNASGGVVLTNKADADGTVDASGGVVLTNQANTGATAEDTPPVEETTQPSQQEEAPADGAPQGDDATPAEDSVTPAEDAQAQPSAQPQPAEAAQEPEDAGKEQEDGQGEG